MVGRPAGYGDGPSPPATPGPDPFEAWIGRERVVEDVLSVDRSRALAATLDRDASALVEGVELPAGWHWVYFHEHARRSDVGEDGHERRGDFLPPIDLPRRMWAGGRLRFSRALTLGAPVRRVSTIRSVRSKEGRAGQLVFVTVEHRVEDDRGPAFVEEQDLVYLGASPESRLLGRTPTPPASEARDADWTEPFVADAVTLFRFSALTFNGHRIHYDRAYAVDDEGYPDIVVHGPLIALLLLDAGLRHERSLPVGLTRPGDLFRYRAEQPLFCDERFALRGRRTGPSGDRSESEVTELWAEHPDRGVTMRARLTTADPSDRREHGS